MDNLRRARELMVVARELTGGGVKRWLEEVSEEMGLEGEITEAVMKEAQKRMKKVRVKRGSMNREFIARELTAVARELTATNYPDGYVPSNSELTKFYRYMGKFYDWNALYPITKNGKYLRRSDIKKATLKLLKSGHVWGGGDSVDREAVRDILLDDMGYEWPDEGKKVAKELVGGIGYDVTIGGGNMGGSIRFVNNVSFPSYGLGDISQMMKSFKSRVESNIIKKLPIKPKSSGEVRMSSQGESARDVALVISYEFQWKKEGEAQSVVDALENNYDVDTLNNSLRL